MYFSDDFEEHLQFLDEQENACRLVLIEDGTPIYRTEAQATWRENHIIEKLVWPQNLPNFNSIEIAWKVFKDCMQKKCRLKNQNEM